MSKTAIIKYIIIGLALMASYLTSAQNTPFVLTLEPIAIEGLGGIQSFAFGQANGKWLILGGRLDGLHRRQPWASFDLAGHNNQLIVIDPVSKQKWTAPLTSLPSSIQEQLSSTNMEFHQENDHLYCLGGYGFSPTENDHTTFDKLTAIHVPNVINAIINNIPFESFFRQITDTKFQVTGGRLQKINSTFYLLGGHKFIGRYNPMGPNNGPGFIQEYTNAIRKFKLVDDGTTITITHLPPHIDPAHLHRRDYNAEPQILPNGNEGITMFSGVFQEDANLPFLNAVNVDSTSYTVQNSFQQYYNHYHCPVLPLYSEMDNEMHTVFFGGLAQFYDDSGTLVQDDNVPFVNTIARVTRTQDGEMAEYKDPLEMPALLGAGAEFIPNTDIPRYTNGVFKLDHITTDSILIGYIFGGIESTQPNIFFINDGTQSIATSLIFKVFIQKPTISSVDLIHPSQPNDLSVLIYPNPSNGRLKIVFNLSELGEVILTIQDMNGQLIEKTSLQDVTIGKNVYEKEFTQFSPNSTYLISLTTQNKTSTHQLIMQR